MFVASRFARRVGSLTACRLRVGFRSSCCPPGESAVVWLERGAQDHLEPGVPITVPTIVERGAVMSVVIGIDPHKALHAACAIDECETELARVELRTGPGSVRNFV